MKGILDLDIPSRGMPPVRLLDVTLRDGGFRVNFDWSIDDVLTISTNCIAAGVDCVELGYIGGVPELHHVDQPGPCANLTPDLIARVRKTVKGGLLAAMIHPSAAVRPIHFDGFRDAGLDIVRFVYNAQWHDQFVSLHRQAADSGLQTAANVALVSRYDIAEIANAIKQVAHHKPHIIYLADTCAALMPDDVAPLIESSIHQSAVGFHAHDFLSLALANSIEAVKAGATWIDVSSCGIGRGAGNLRLEMVLALRARTAAHRGSLAPLLQTLRLIEERTGQSSTPDLASIVAGALNLTPPQEDHLRQLGMRTGTSASDVAAYLCDNHRKHKTIASVFESETAHRD